MHRYLTKLTLTSGRKVVRPVSAASRQAAIARAESLLKVGQYGKVASYEASLIK
jgi:hypothetical protein